jgi:hypothetical protein
MPWAIETSSCPAADQFKVCRDVLGGWLTIRRLADDEKVVYAGQSSAPELSTHCQSAAAPRRMSGEKGSRSLVKREGPRGLDRRLLKAFSVTDFSLVAIDEMVLHHLKIDPPLTTNPEGRQLPQAHAAIDRRLRDPKVRGQLFQRDHFGVGNSSVPGNLVICSVRWLAPSSVAGGCGV